MGRPYEEELHLLPKTYSWASTTDIASLARAVSFCAGIPLLAVGSGGAFTAAHFAALIHQHHFGVASQAVTPMGLMPFLGAIRKSAVLFMTAGGSNPDVLGVFRRVVVSEPRQIIVLTGRKASPLADLVNRYSYVDIASFDLPSGRDGFLATNSLLAFSATLRRAYNESLALRDDAPRHLSGLMHPGEPADAYLKRLRRCCAPLWQRDVLLVLYGPTAFSAATDLESRFSEAALGSVQIADYRNFAHGRHHWLAKRGQVSAVLALVTSEDRGIALRTIRLIPPSIPVATVGVPHQGTLASLAAIAIGMHVAGLAGEAKGIDPGRPGVPLFGRRIYHLNAFPKIATGLNPRAKAEALAIERKLGMSIQTLKERGYYRCWAAAYRRSVRNLECATFRGVVLDYDGTLCDCRHRWEGWHTDLVSEVVRLLRGGTCIGIATGRGKSVKADLRRAIPKSLWHRVVVGYYNGADVSPLSEDNHPITGRPRGQLLSLARSIKSSVWMRRIARFEFRPMQISVTPKAPWSVVLVWDMLQPLLSSQAAPGVTAVRSAHSIDILAPGVTKNAVVMRTRQESGGENASVLCIGDCGRFPGNDWELLEEPFSLSVDEVSPALETCWNLAPAGIRGPQATRHYLEALTPVDSMGGVRIAICGKVR